MHIFVDESGPFIPLDGREPRVSCIGALAVPDTLYGRLREAWEGLREDLRPGAAEVKGSELTELEVIRVATLVRQFDVVLKVNAVDAGLHHNSEVNEFKEAQALLIGADLPEEATQFAKEQVAALQAVTRSLSNQEFMQGFVTIALLEQFVPLATNYYAQRRPKELANYHWIIDAKGRGLSRSETFWTDLILPALQRYSETNPFPLFPFGDYSSFDRHHLSPDDPGVFLPPGIPKPDRVINSSQIYREHLDFGDSVDHAGLQLVDIMTNAVCRAMNGRLGRSAWCDLGRMMLREHPSPLRLVSLKSASKPAGTRVHDPYQEVSHELYRCAKSMVAARYSHLVREGTT